MQPTMTSKGQITIPRDLRRHFGLHTGTAVRFEIEGDHIAFRYEILQECGRGAFGQVLKCIDHKTGKEVAIKIVRKDP